MRRRPCKCCREAMRRVSADIGWRRKRIIDARKKGVGVWWADVQAYEVVALRIARRAIWDACEHVKADAGMRGRRCATCARRLEVGTVVFCRPAWGISVPVKSDDICENFVEEHDGD